MQEIGKILQSLIPVRMEAAAGMATGGAGGEEERCDPVLP